MTDSIERFRVHTLQNFYDLMDQTAIIRRNVTQNLLSNAAASSQDIQSLRTALDNLEAISQTESSNAFDRRLMLDDTYSVDVNLDYEMTELARDVTYLESGENDLLTSLEDRSPGVRQQAKKLADKLRGAFAGPVSYSCFITDRDGTVNNYCGRYRSSVQAVYNAVFLSRFAHNRVAHPMVITSGPLSGPGLQDVNVMPAKTYILAASKGREYIDLTNDYGRFPVQDAQLRILQDVHHRLDELLSTPIHRKFSLIGSGLQVKFGQLTVARQDISKSIPAQESKEFLQTVTDLVRACDPHNEFLRIEDTGLDIEIILTIQSDKGRKDFDKGDGVAFLDKTLGLNLAQGRQLVCGDTFSDVPMLRVTMERCPQTQAVFVTTNQELQDAVLEICTDAHFVDQPDALVLALRLLS
jgi:hypothetical protein